jgi:uncharacterized protein
VRSEVLARGDLEVRVTMLCARCLEPATVEVAAEFAATYVPTGTLAGEDGEEPDVQFYSEDEIDLSQLLREQVILGIPLSTLCRPECKGLCPQCGAELNLGACGCRPPASTHAQERHQA